jgi:hypothetical protein
LENSSWFHGTTKWVPKYPVPTSGGGQPGASWDPEHGHWDVDNGKKVCTRVFPHGTILDGQHEVDPDGEFPEPFLGPDPAIIAMFAGIGMVLILLRILLFIFSTVTG